MKPVRVWQLFDRCIQPEKGVPSHPLKVSVHFAGNRWSGRAEAENETFEAATLRSLISAVRKDLPHHVLIFIVDQDSIAGNPYAETQFMEATDSSNLRVKANRRRFDDV